MKTMMISLLLLSSCASYRPTPTARFVPSVTAAERSISSTLSPDEIDALWVRTSKNKDSLIRSNPTHYWAWMKENTPPSLSDVTEFEGQVVADAHYFNFADVHNAQESGLAVVDIDDSGVGSFYLDFIRYAIFVKAYLGADYTPDLFQAYTDGLTGKSQEVPLLLSAPINHSRQELDAANSAWVNKNLTADHQFDNKALDLTTFKELNANSPDKVTLGKDLENLLVANKRVQQIYDHAYMVTDSGSSRGMDRFWYSVLTNKNEIRIMECKELSEPATAYFTKQNQHVQRVADVLKFYSDVAVDDSFVFNSLNESYWCRPRHFAFFERSTVENERQDTEKMLEYSRYLAFWMGRKQRLQPDADKLLKELKDNRNQVLSDTIDLIVVYENHVFDLGKKKK